MGQATGPIDTNHWLCRTPPGVCGGAVSAEPASSSCFPDVATAIEQWRKVSPKTQPDDHVFAKGPRGHPEKGPQPLDRDRVEDVFRGFEERQRIKHIPAPLFRHWVKTTCRGLGDPAIAALQGHKPPNRGMRGVYDTPDQDLILDEQAQLFPDGPVGAAFSVVQVRMDDDLKELAALWEQLKAVRMKLSEFSDRVSDLKAKVSAQGLVVPR